MPKLNGIENAMAGKLNANNNTRTPCIEGKGAMPRTVSNLPRLFVSPSLLPNFPRFHTLPLPSKRKAFSFIPLLKHCRSIEDLKPLKTLLIVQGLMHNTLLVGEFLKSCFHLGSPATALALFQTINIPSLSLQNLMIRNLSHHGQYEDLLCVYIKCRVSGCSSDNFTFPFVIKACSHLGAVGIGKEIHCVVLRTGYHTNIVIQTTLIDFYARNGDMGTARVLIDRIPQPDLVSWNALIAGYSFNGLDQEAFEVFRRIRSTDLKPNVSTLASVIPVCTRLGWFCFGKSLHGFIVKSGYISVIILVPALISMYASALDLYAAKKLFDSVVEKNVTVWNAMLSAYTQRKKFFEAFEIFRGMVRAQLKPDLVTFVSIIPSCDDHSSISHGESLHACAIKQGLENQVSVLTALVSMYAKVGDVNSAGFLFDQIPNRNLLSWNAMISGYVSNGLCHASLAVFCEMQFAGFIPDAVSIVSVLSACSKQEEILLGKSAHAYSVRKGIDLNLDVSNALLMFYSDCGKLFCSLEIFHKMPGKNAVSWNTIISGCVQGGEVEQAVSFLKQMRKEGAVLDMVTLISIVPCYNEKVSLKQGIAIHCYAIKSGFISDVSLMNALITMYCNCGNLNHGRLLFEIMHERSLVSWNALITGYRYRNLQNDVLVLFGRMRMEGQKPNHVTLLNLLPVCCTQVQCKSAHAFAIRTGLVHETTLLTSLLLMYARFENTKLCLLLFQMGDKRDISLWNAIMSVHVQTKSAKQTFAFFNALLCEELEPDRITVLSLVSACVQLNSLNHSHSVMACVIIRGFDKDVAVNNALIDLYVRCGCISIAKKLFESLHEKDDISWGVMINGYGLHGDGDAALDLFVQMQHSGVRPNEITYSSILSACSHAGLVEQSQMMFNCMLDHGVSPTIEHYACMVDLLGRTGHLNEAYNIVKQISCKSSVGLLESLLGACKIHGSVEIGEKISEMLFEMDPENPGSYVMLHNIYASTGRWEDASRVRHEMERRRLKKVRGFSLVRDDIMEGSN